MPLIPLIVVLILAAIFGCVFGIRWERFRPEKYHLEPHNAIRALTLACGDDSRKHPDACQELAALGDAGYKLMLTGSTRSGWIRIEIANPLRASKLPPKDI